MAWTRPIQTLKLQLTLDLPCVYQEPTAAPNLQQQLEAGMNGRDLTTSIRSTGISTNISSKLNAGSCSSKFIFVTIYFSISEYYSQACILTQLANPLSAMPTSHLDTSFYSIWSIFIQLPFNGPGKQRKMAQMLGILLSMQEPYRKLLAPGCSRDPSQPLLPSKE